MKKIISTTILIFCMTSLFAQTDFLQFINLFNWNSTEKETVEKYASMIKKGNHGYSDYFKTTTDYIIEGIILGGNNCTASIEVDSISRKIYSLNFSFGGLEKTKDAKTLCVEMDKILYDLFGDPDKKKDDEDSKYMKGYDREWIKDKYIITVRHMVFTDMHLYSLTVMGVEDKGNDFRVAKWGDSKASIMKKEGKPDSANMDRLYMFSDVVAGLSCDVVYIFTNDKLTMAKYMFNPTHTNKNDYIMDFKNLVNLMTEKYGKPSYNEPEWRNSLYKDDTDQYGFAVSLGHLSYSAGWLGKTTDLTVALHGDNYEIKLLIQYVSKKYEGLKDKQDIQNKIKDL